MAMAITWQLGESSLRPAPSRASARAREWRRYERMLGPIGQRVLDALRVVGGERLLDVGCGAGGLTLSCAHRTTKSGCVVGVDGDVHAIAVARSRAGEQSLAEAIFALADVSDAELPSAAFHGAVSRFGLATTRDLGRALLRVSRALLPGGKLSFSAWADREQNAWFVLPRRAIAHCLGERAREALSHSALGPSAFDLAERARTRAELERASFVDVRFESLESSVWVGDDVDDAVEFFFETEGRALDSGLDDDQLRSVTRALRDVYAAYGRPDGVWMPASAWLITARSAG